jgi:hypothetical protein
LIRMCPPGSRTASYSNWQTVVGESWAYFAVRWQTRNVGLWHECDIARSRLDFRFRGKNGHAADITGTTEFDPNAVMERAKMPQCSGLLPDDGVLSLVGSTGGSSAPDTETIQVYPKDLPATLRLNVR